MTDFYKDKGKLRYTVITTEQHREKLNKIAKTYRISQGDVIEVLLDQANLGLLGHHFDAKRESKSDGKLTKTELMKKMKGLTPEQLAAIEKIIGQGEASAN